MPSCKKPLLPSRFRTDTQQVMEGLCTKPVLNTFDCLLFFYKDNALYVKMKDAEQKKKLVALHNSRRGLKVFGLTQHPHPCPESSFVRQNDVLSQNVKFTVAIASTKTQPLNGYVLDSDLLPHPNALVSTFKHASH